MDVVMWVVAALGLLGSMALALLGVGVLLARKVAGWTIRRDEKVLSVSERTISFLRTPETEHPGVFVVHFAGGSAEVGRVLSSTSGSTGGRGRRGDRGSVTRELIRVHGDSQSLTALRQASTVRWEGETHVDLMDVGSYEHVVVQGPTGPCPAWKFLSSGANQEQGSPVSSVWAVHIHGIRADRHNAVRSVESSLRAGMPSLVVSYRGDGEGPPVKRRLGPVIPGGLGFPGAASLGCAEWEDIDSAVGFALAHGAAKVVLVGWSMGASIALQTAERSAHRDRIAGLVLISPATDWRGIIAHGAKTRGLPAIAGKLGHFMLSHPSLSAIAGLASPVDLDLLDWTVTGRLQTPTLVVHSRGDKTVPFEITEQFVRAGGGHVTLLEAQEADHSWEYNVAPEWFTQSVSNWLLSIGQRQVLH